MAEDCITVILPNFKFFFPSALLIFMFFCLPSSSVSLLYFNITVPMRKSSGTLLQKFHILFDFVLGFTLFWLIMP